MFLMAILLLARGNFFPLPFEDFAVAVSGAYSTVGHESRALRSFQIAPKLYHASHNTARNTGTGSPHRRGLGGVSCDAFVSARVRDGPAP
ncbi:hypothetical protein [uncultured Dysosmobacter sp.]|uniref:hypothetical protein n=1 Tax=uncultured Dysosmobacter sp. TaxID=2591384 RepID=UPI00262120A1|nr:hypothetical protein [uncultured Dysosmobacter sp.]